MNRIFFLVSAIFLSSCAHSDWQQDKDRLMTLVNNEDYTQAWEMTWRYAKQGNTEAISALAGGVYMTDMSPPNYPQDAYSKIRLVYVLSVFGMSNAESSAKEIALDLSHSPPLNNISTPFVECVKAAPSNYKPCQQIAIDNHLVPDWNSFIKEIDHPNHHF